MFFYDALPQILTSNLHLLNALPSPESSISMMSDLDLSCVKHLPFYDGSLSLAFLANSTDFSLIFGLNVSCYNKLSLTELFYSFCLLIFLDLVVVQSVEFLIYLSYVCF